MPYASELDDYGPMPSWFVPMIVILFVATIFFAWWVDHRKQDLEADGVDYSLVAGWYDQFQGLQPDVDAALADEVLTEGEFRAIWKRKKEEAFKLDKSQALRDIRDF